MDVSKTSVFLLDMMWIGVLLWASFAYAQSDPCAGVSNAIYLPQSSRCLMPVSNAKDWVAAQRNCETQRGDLFRLPDDRLLTSAPGVTDCLSAMPAAENMGNDLWLGAVSRWIPHWYWVNGTLLNPIRYTTVDLTAFTRSTTFEVCTSTLSVDYCVSVCHSDAAAYTVFYQQGSYPCCFCSFQLDPDKVNVTSSVFINFNDPTVYSVAESREGASSIVSLASSETLTTTETLCAVVDTTTSDSRELFSKTCFSKFPFLCSLGNVTQCDGTSCQGTQCRFLVRDECVQRDARPLTWLEAGAECVRAGGDLWTVGKLDDMYVVSRYLLSKTFYWVGATNHLRDYIPESNVFGVSAPNYDVVRCAHMFQESSGVTDQARRWTWSDTRCDQQKSYVCQFEQTTVTAADTDDVVQCPWNIPVVTAPPVTTSTAGVAPTPGGTALPPVTVNNSVIPDTGEPYTGSSSYPIVPIIAACIAALVITMCAIFMLGYSRRRRWLMKKWKKTREYVWPWWASSPSYLPPDYLSDRGMDTMSSAHTDNGSVFYSPSAFVYPEPAFPMPDGAAYKGQSPRRKWSSSQLNGNRKPSRDTLDGVGSSVGGFGAGVLGGEGGGGGGGGAGEGGGVGGDSFAATDEHLMSSSYASLSPRAREYQTLSARMDIADDFGTLGRASGQSQGRPEVALVTSDVDLNFTVNHAYSRSASRESRSRPGSSEISGGGLDEGWVGGGGGGGDPVPLSPTVQVPTRAMEKAVTHL